MNSSKTKSTALWGVISASAFFIFICYLIFQADTDQENFFLDLAEKIQYGDKIGHFTIFGCFALLINLATGNKTFQVKRWRLHYGAVAVLIFAIAEEFTQLAFESRTFDFGDMLCDLLGVYAFSSERIKSFLLKQFRRIGGLFQPQK